MVFMDFMVFHSHFIVHMQHVCVNTLKNKGASRCHRRIFLSNWFHKEPLTSEESFYFTKASLWRKGSSDYKKLRKRWFFKEPLTELILCGTKNGSSMASLEEPFEAPLFLRAN